MFKILLFPSLIKIFKWIIQCLPIILFMCPHPKKHPLYATGIGKVLIKKNMMTDAMHEYISVPLFTLYQLLHNGEDKRDL